MHFSVGFLLFCIYKKDNNNKRKKNRRKKIKEESWAYEVEESEEGEVEARAGFERGGENLLFMPLSWVMKLDWVMNTGLDNFIFFRRVGLGYLSMERYLKIWVGLHPTYIGLDTCLIARN